MKSDVLTIDTKMYCVKLRQKNCVAEGFKNYSSSKYLDMLT